jgi:IclR family transcriptional regulator, KDG regulon repressor
MEHSAATVEKAIDVLFHLHERAEPWGVSELSRALKLPKSSVHRLLVALRRRGLVEHDARGYRPGIVLLALGLGVLEREPLVIAARPVLEASAAELNETFFAVAARAGALTVLDKVEGKGFLRAAPHVGQTIPVQGTAVGRLYLALAPSTLQPVAPPQPKLPVRSGRARSSSSVAADERDLSLVRRRGFAENVSGWIEGLAVYAGPVYLRTRMVGAIAVALPTPRLIQIDRKQVIESVVRAAAQVSARMLGR